MIEKALPKMQLYKLDELITDLKLQLEDGVAKKKLQTVGKENELTRLRLS